MRRFVLFLVLVSFAAGCGPLLSARPPTPTPTPVSLKPSNLLTPRPTLEATATPAPRAAKPTPQLASTTPTIKGTPVAASEPLQGFFLDDRFYSPIIGESFVYRVYLPPDYVRSPQRHYPVLYMLHGNGGNYTEWSDSYLPEQADRMISDAEIPPLIIVMPDDAEATYWAN